MSALGSVHSISSSKSIDLLDFCALVKKCLTTEMLVEISRQLGQAVDKICQGQGTVGLFEDLLDDFIDESDFMD